MGEGTSEEALESPQWISLISLRISLSKFTASSEAERKREVEAEINAFEDIALGS